MYILKALWLPVLRFPWGQCWRCKCIFFCIIFFFFIYTFFFTFHIYISISVIYKWNKPIVHATAASTAALKYLPNLCNPIKMFAYVSLRCKTIKSEGWHPPKNNKYHRVTIYINKREFSSICQDFTSHRHSVSLCSWMSVRPSSCWEWMPLLLSLLRRYYLVFFATTP